MKKYILILGALSDIAKSTAHKFASNGYNLLLAARKISELEIEYKDFKSMYNIDLNFYEFDVLKSNTHQSFIENLKEIPSIIICAVGYMGDQKVSEKEINSRTEVLRTNYEGPLNIISEFANIFEKRGNGTIVGISSVAGERGRSTNYIYGSAKAGFTAFLSGLRNRLANKNVHVLTILPGTVYTKMTVNFNLPKFITSHPDKVSNDIYSAVLKKKDVIYTMRIWQFIMIIIRLIPEGIFKKLKL